MGNPIKYSTTITSGSYQKGNNAIGVNPIGYGPTANTGWYNSVTPAGGNFIVAEVIDGNTSPRFYAPTTDAEWLNLARQEGATGADTGSTTAIKNWFASQANYVITNIDFSSSLPSIVGNGLNLNINSQFPQSYPGTGTTWTDISGLGNDQTLVNGPTYNSGLKTIVFDGVDDGTYGISTNDAGLTNEITMEALFYNTSGQNDRAIIMNKENTYEFGINNSTGQLQWAIASPGPGWAWWGAGADVRNKWTHGVITRSSDGTERSYVNGVLITAQGGTAGNITLQTNRLNIAGRGGGTSLSSNFGGQIANIKRYFRALTQAEILQNYHQGNIATDGLLLAMDAGNLVSYASGSTLTYSLTGSISGSLFNGTGYNSGNGGSWVFDGVDDFISIPYTTTLDPTQGITIEAWINPINLTSTRYMEIFRKENSSARQLFSFQEYGTILSFGTSTSTTGYNELDVSISNIDYVNQWTQVVCTYSSVSGIKTIYRNSVQIGATTVAGTLNTGTATYYIASNQSLSEFFNGKIAMIRMYDRALSSTEVLQNFNAQRSRFGI